MGGYSHILWDFNGTILDDAQAAMDSENLLLARRNMPRIQSLADYRACFCLPVAEYYTKLGHDFARESYQTLAEEWVARYLECARSAPLGAGVAAALAAFKARGTAQLVLSATERGMLRAQLEALGVLEYFDDVLGLDDIYAHSKVAIAQAWAQRAKPKRPLVVGDTLYDFEVAQALGAECVLLLGGHQDRERLERCGVPLLQSAQELLAWV